VVINVVTYEMVNQVSLASAEFAEGVDEFVKAGFTKLPSEKVRPFRVKESPVQIECKVREVIETGTGGGAGNLVICEVLAMHVREEVLAEDGLIDQQKIRLVGRMGRDWYCRAFGEGIFKVEKPLDKSCIGIDALPEVVRNSKFLSGNELGRFGNLENLPSRQEIEAMNNYPGLKEALSSQDKEKDICRIASSLIENGKVREALALLWQLV
jgi:hypothetical protein